jgi:hypothetical protein
MCPECGGRVEIVRRSLDKVDKATFDVDAFLGEVRRSAQVAAVSPALVPLLGSLWYLFDSSKFWFRSPLSSPLVRAAERGGELAVIVDDFNPPVSIRQIRVRGHSRIEHHDPALVRQLYERYLGTNVDNWPPLFQGTVGSTQGWVLGRYLLSPAWRSLRRDLSKRSTAGTLSTRRPSLNSLGALSV